MRVSQIQNLTWVGNVVVLGGLVWVGLQFWGVRKQKPSAEWKWPTAKTVDAGVRWPGDLATFDAIWKTPIGGKNPPPPKPPDPPPKLDRWAEFQGKLKYNGGMEYVGAPVYSTARLGYDGKDFSVSPGGMVGSSGFQLLSFAIDEAKRTASLVFRHPDTGASMTWTQTLPVTAPLTGGKGPFTKKHEPPFDEGRAPRKGPLAATAFADPTTGEWIIPEEELIWMQEYGEEDLWSKLVVKSDVDAQGVSHGLRIVTQPEQPTPLAPTHGVNVGDIVRSINGVPMTAKEDVPNYLRGEGKGLSTYRVVVDSDGKERTVVFHVGRPRPGH